MGSGGALDGMVSMSTWLLSEEALVGEKWRQGGQGEGSGIRGEVRIPW